MLYKTHLIMFVRDVPARQTPTTKARLGFQQASDDSSGYYDVPEAAEKFLN